jgi:nitrogen fixation protein NifU and related proteins
MTSDTFDDLRDLYQEVILDHGRRPRHARRLESFDATAKGDNPMCGDRIEVWVKYGPDGTIADTGFQARGCAISVASADLMAETVVGRSKADTHALFDAFREMARTGKCPHCGAAGTSGAAGRRARVSVAGEMRDAGVACVGRRVGRGQGGEQ